MAFGVCRFVTGHAHAASEHTPSNETGQTMNTHTYCLNCGDSFGQHSPDPDVHPCDEWHPSTLAPAPCGHDTIYRDGVCGDCRTDSPAIPAGAHAIYDRDGIHTDSRAWKLASATEHAVKVWR